MRDVMDRNQVCEYLSLTSEEFDTLFPAPPVFFLAGNERYRREDLLEWLDEVVKTQYQARERKGLDTFRTASDYMLARDFEKAAPLLKEAIGLDRSAADFHFNYGFCLYQLERFEESDIEFRKALELDPKGEWRDAAKYHLSEIERMKMERIAREKQEAESTLLADEGAPESATPEE